MARTVLAVCAAVMLGSIACDLHPEGDRNEVILYCSVDQTVAEPVVTAFEKATGITVKARYDTEASKTVGLIQRIRAEAAAPVADVFWSGEVFHTIALAREGLCAPWQGPPSWPAQFKDAADRWHGFALRARVVAYNTSRVSAEEAPTILEDLLEPTWQGRLVMADPEFGTTGGHVASWFVLYGPDRAQKILEGLRRNEIRLVAGNSTAVRLVAMGQADVCLTDTDDVHAATRQGWPVAMHLLGHGTQGPLAIPNTAALLRNAPNKAQAARLMAFLTGPETETLLARSHSRNAPLHPDVAARFPQLALPEPLSIDYAEVAAQLATALRAARSILR